MTVAFPGERGAFSEAAARALIPRATFKGMSSYAQVVESVVSGDVARGILPVESSITGGMGAAWDLLIDRSGAQGISVVGEHWLRVELALVALPGTDVGDVVEVRSHTEALRQADAFLSHHLPKALRIRTPDTAGAARLIASEKIAGAAALASADTAELYGLEVVARIQPEYGAHVRFFLVAPAGTHPDAADKATLVLTPSLQAPNALFRALTTFVGRRLSLYRMEPRPRKGRPGEYHYLVDVEGDARREPLAAAVVDAQAFCERLAVLGSYPAATVG